MNRLIAEKRIELNALFKRYRVGRIELFGSATSDRFDPQTSDLDFLVEFAGLGPGEYAEAYFGLLEACKSCSSVP